MKDPDFTRTGDWVNGVWVEKFFCSGCNCQTDYLCPSKGICDACVERDFDPNLDSAKTDVAREREGEEN